jgi:hypothetical protein
MKTEREIKLQNFMAWCNTKLLKWKPELTAEFEDFYGTTRIVIRKLKGSEFFTSVVMLDVIQVADEIGLSCFFEQKDGKVQIEITR